MFYLLGAEGIWTCDQLRHAKWELIQKTINALPKRFHQIAEKTGVGISTIECRYDSICKANALGPLLMQANINYIAPSVFHSIQFPSGFFDVFYTYSTLQRVPPAQLVKYYQAARRALKLGGFSVHCFHHSDHNARGHAGLGKLDYLRWEDWFYDSLQSKRFNYQNRLRHQEFWEIEAQSGFELIDEKLTREAEEALRGIKVARRFRTIPPDDLLVTRTQSISCRVSDNSISPRSYPS